MKEQQVITDEFIKRGTSDRGGWSKRQLACLGVDWPPLKGWKHRIIGTVIPAEDADRFLSREA